MDGGSCRDTVHRSENKTKYEHDVVMRIQLNKVERRNERYLYLKMINISVILTDRQTDGHAYQ